MGLFSVPWSPFNASCGLSLFPGKQVFLIYRAAKGIKNSSFPGRYKVHLTSNTHRVFAWLGRKHYISVICRIQKRLFLDTRLWRPIIMKTKPDSVLWRQEKLSWISVCLHCFKQQPACRGEGMKGGGGGGNKSFTHTEHRARGFFSYKVTNQLIN